MTRFLTTRATIAAYGAVSDKAVPLGALGGNTQDKPATAEKR